ncbi:hypothetical protein [Pseudomonas laurentiana]
MHIITVVRWVSSVGGKIFRVVPNATLMVVLFTLASQICSLLAALLPLKVIILLGSERIPVYFPALLHDFHRSTLILGLSTTAVVFFVFHLLAEALIGRLSAYGARSLIARSRKLTLFDKQEEILSKAYQRFAGALAGVVFIVIASVSLIMVYPLQALVILLYITIVWFALTLVHRCSSLLDERVEHHLTHLIGVFATLGFFITFGCIVADILLGSEVSVFWAIFTLLLVRQVFRRCSSFISDLINLYAQRLQLNALLFRGHVYAGKSRPAGSSTLWSLAESQTVCTWMTPLIRRLTDRDTQGLDIRIVQSGTAEVIQWRVISQDERGEHSYLVRLFGQTKSALARHEASLFTAMNQGISPLPRLRLVDEVETFHCHVFDWPATGSVDSGDSKQAPMHLLRALFGLCPNATLVALFSRSRPMLWQRLDEQVLPRLELYDGVSGVNLVRCWEAALDTIRIRLERLPLAVVTSDLSPDGMGYDERRDLWASQWGRWTLEPIGAGWPVSEKAFALLDGAFAEAQDSRPDLREVDLNDVKLAALVFAFDRACQRQNYRTAVELLTHIIPIFNRTRI